MTLKKALEKIDASVDAYRALLADSPQDYEEAAERQLEAADILDEAQTLGDALSGDDRRTFMDRFADANLEIENLETKRIQGGAEDFDDEDIEDEDDAPEDAEEVENPEPESPDSEDDKAELYSSMAEPEAEDEIEED